MLQGEGKKILHIRQKTKDKRRKTKDERRKTKDERPEAEESSIKYQVSRRRYLDTCVLIQRLVAFLFCIDEEFAVGETFKSLLNRVVDFADDGVEALFAHYVTGDIGHHLGFNDCAGEG